MRWKHTATLLILGALIPVLIVAAGLTAIYLAGSRRPTPPPDAAAYGTPWGSVDLETVDTLTPSGVQTTITEALRSEDSADRGSDGRLHYDFLALSGGGSYGAFGAGMLCGWTDRGDRPDFKVVTGISTGALQATPAFLGSAYDPLLKRFYTTTTNDSIFRRRSTLTSLFADGTLDSTPLRRLLEGAIDDDVLAAVAAKHRAGHRLFIGTSNMDANEFAIWDMGAIAASGRPDARRRYIDVLVASASVPVVFPPVYFDVDIDGKTYYEMHSDGGAEAQVFLRGFMLDVEDALEGAGLARGEVKARLFVIRNGRADDRPGYASIKPMTLAIAEATIGKLFKITAAASLYRMYVLANRYGVEFNLRCIPDDYLLDFDGLNFDRPRMNTLFNHGYELGRGSADWLHAPPDLDPDELVPTPATAPASDR